MAKDKEFVHLHVHTDYSLLDGCSRIDRLCEKAAMLGHKALAITDHGVLFGLADFYKKAGKAGVKPLLGCEIYLVYEEELGTTNEERAKQKSYHMGLLAKNFTGYQNLTKLVSLGHTKGFYRNARVSMRQLAEHAEGLIAFSGCLAAVIPQHLKNGDFEGARQACGRFVEIFGKESFFIELMDHGIEEQLRVIPGLLKLAQEFGLKTVATNDVHYVNDGDWAPHDSLLCIQTGAKLADEKRMRYDSHQHYLKSREEMEAIFERHDPKAVTNTAAVAEMCEVKLPFGEDHYPVYEKPVDLSYAHDLENFNRILDEYEQRKNAVLTRDGKEPITLSQAQRDAFAKNGLYLFELCKEGLKERYGVDYDLTRAKLNAIASGAVDPATLPESERVSEFDTKLLAQLEYELAIIIGTGFTDYFLIVWDFIKWARDRGIPVGPGRGSGAGCIVAYVLKITDIDPLRFGLLFERMLNLERVSPPDFDVDFCMRRRDDVVRYVREKYGEDRVANIITFGTFGAKMIVRDLARVNGVEYAEADKIAKMVPDVLNISLDDAVEMSAELRGEVKTNPVAKKIIEQGKVIEGMVRNTGKHACGIIIADQPITNLIPVCLQEGDLTTQYPKGPSEDLGLLKCDFLGLKTLTVISDAQDNVRRLPGCAQVDIERVSLEDPKTFQLLKEAKTVGVFQLESGGMQALCRQLEVSSIDEIVALIALYRPGPMQFIPQYIKGKKDRSTIEVPHPLLKEMVEETYGVLVYQEQVMQAAQIIAGYTLGGADMLRRAMGKKIKSEMDAQRDVFVRGAAQTNSIPQKQAEHIFSILEKFAQYGFNKSHSAAYAMLSYRTAYLKANYPTEFMAAVLSSELGNSEKLAHFISEAEEMGIEVLGPDVNESHEMFSSIIPAAAKNAADGVAAKAGTVGGDIAVSAANDAALDVSAGERGVSVASEGSGTAAVSGSAQSTSGGASQGTFSPSRPDYSTPGRVRFGMAAIKGVGDAAARAIIAEREAGGVFADFRDFIFRVDLRAINRRVVEHLVKTGAFDYSGVDRQHLLDSVDRLMGEASERQKDREKGQANLFDMFGDDAAATGDGGSGTSGNYVMVNPPMPQAEKLQFEKDLLGFYVSGHPMNAYAGLDDAINSFAPGEDLKRWDGEPFRLCGVVNNLVKKLTKKDNRMWAFFTLSTRRATYQINVFPDAYEQNISNLAEGMVVCVEGEVRYNADREETRLNANKLSRLENTLSYYVEGVTFFLRNDETAICAFAKDLRTFLDANEGGTRIEIAVEVSPTQVLHAEIAGSLKCRLQPESYHNLRRHPAVTRVTAKTRPVEAPPKPRWAQGRRG